MIGDKSVRENINTKKGMSTQKPLINKYLKSAVYDCLNHIKVLIGGFGCRGSRLTRTIKNAESRVFLRGFGKGLDKEMGMSGLDALAPVRKAC